MALTPFGFTLATTALLAAPGPTNILLAASGAAVGLRGSLKLVLAGLCGYLVTIVTLRVGVGSLLVEYPFIGTALKLAACAWVACCAVRLWREAANDKVCHHGCVSFGRVFITTLVNPKAVIFSLVLIPAGSVEQIVPYLVLFSGLTAAISTLWIGLGRLLARSAGTNATPFRIWRLAAVGLALFATIAASI
jgi:threonine/homoserine/homoserine lactone efflux protein